MTRGIGETTEQPKKDDLSAASKLVSEAIYEYQKNLEKILNTEKNDPIKVRGVTSAHYDCELMVDPRDVAKIILEYDFPVCHILGREYPFEMWEALGRKFGLLRVSGFDL